MNSSLAPENSPPGGSVDGLRPRGRVAVDIRSLRVDYGDFVAVDDLTLAVPPGEILGIVGPNGAGKTSTFRVLATLMEPTHGDVFFDGVDIAENPRQARRLMGYMPDLAPVPSDLKVWEFLDFYAAAYGLRDAHERRQRADRCLESVGLSNLRNNGCRELSRGQTQRVVLAQTHLHEPRVLLHDEPARGRDPQAQISRNKKTTPLRDE
jgi:ABC-2 type transport system ATP-binding protein